MSSAVYLFFTPPIPLEDWVVFCNEQDITYSPQTVGRNVFYAGDVEISFGDQNLAPLPQLPDGRLDFSAASPGSLASEITVSTFWMGKAIPDVARIAKLILGRWSGTMQCDPELTRFMYWREAPSLTTPSAS